MQSNSLLLHFSFHLDAFHLPGDRLSRVWGMQRPQWAQWTEHCSDTLCDLLSTSTTAEANCSRRPSSCSLLGPSVLRMLQILSTEFLFQWTRVALCPKIHNMRSHKTQDRTASFWVKDDREYIKIKVTEALLENSQGTLLSRIMGTAQNQAWPSIITRRNKQLCTKQILVLYPCSFLSFFCLIPPHYLHFSLIPQKRSQNGWLII